MSSAENAHLEWVNLDVEQLELVRGRLGQDKILMLRHPLIDFEILRYFQNKQRFTALLLEYHGKPKKTK